MEPQILRELARWGIDDGQAVIKRHGIEAVQVTILALKDADPSKARNPSGVFMARLHQVVAQQAEAASAGPTAPVIITDSDPEIDLVGLWKNTIKAATIAPNAKQSIFGPGPHSDDNPFGDGAFKLIAFSVDKVAVVEVSSGLYLEVFNFYGAAIQKALGAEEIRLVVKSA